MSVVLSSAPSPTIGLVIPPTALVIAGGLVGRLNACVARVDAEIGVLRWEVLSRLRRPTIALNHPLTALVRGVANWSIQRKQSKVEA